MERRASSMPSDLYMPGGIEVGPGWSETARAARLDVVSDAVISNVGVALLHLSSSASSVPAECMFSVAGLLTNSKRSRLTADKLHRICFIHDNYSLAL